MPAITDAEHLVNACLKRIRLAVDHCESVGGERVKFPTVTSQMTFRDR